MTDPNMKANILRALEQRGPLLIGSMVFNYLIGGYLRRQPSRTVLALGVTANVALLGYYKYTGFLFGTLDEAFALGWSVGDIILPLAISFFTFQQIAYLVDAHDGEVSEHDPIFERVHGQNPNR